MVTKRTTAKKTASKRPRRTPASLDPTLWDRIAKLFESVPEAEWRNVPTDASRRFDEILEDEGI